MYWAFESIIYSLHPASERYRYDPGGLSPVEMIYLLYGEDDFSIHEFVGDLQRQIGPEELTDANTTTLDGLAITPRQLQEACSVVPFLAQRRLIVVKGLFQRFEEQGGQGRSGRSPRSRGQTGDEWANLAEMLAQIPDTTLVVFVDGRLRRDNPLLHRMTPLAQVHEFPSLSGQALNRWIRQRVASTGSAIRDGAIRLLMDHVGGDLWVLSNEIEKLALYSGGDDIEEEAVRLLVGRSREASVFSVIDATLEGRASTALQLLGRLLQSGAEAPYVITMLARQLRLALLAQELLAKGVAQAELGRRLGLSAQFAVRRTEEQARRYSQDHMVAMHRRLLDTDLSIKQGTVAEEMALEALVAEMCSSAKLTAPRPNRS